MKRIDSNARTISELLANTKYQLDYYQREYSWETKHVTELLDDLSRKFLESYTEGDTLTNVPSYEHYFLGSIIISHSEGQRYIVDGQQRLTTLTLLLIGLYRSLEEGSLKNQVEQCIYSLSGGTEGFNLDVSDWNPIMKHLYPVDKRDDEPFNFSDKQESVRNIAARYNDIEGYFEIQGEAILSFAYWLLENVYLVEIAAYDSRDAYAIFETVNDRGLSLTPADMLRGYLLSNIKDIGRRDRASGIWRKCSQTLKQIGRGEESEAIKTWLRSQHAGSQDSAESVRDFDAIGSEFHRWVQERRYDLGIKSPPDFANFIERDFEFYASWYCRLRNAANSFTDAVEDGLECVYYNAQNNFTLQYPMLLSSLCIEDTEDEILQKIQIVATYLDILIHRRIWNFQDISQRTMADLMPPVIPSIRGKSASELSGILYTRLEAETLPFTNNSVFGLHGGNRRKIFRILARMTEYVGIRSEESSRYLEYVRTGRNRYEIEHIWANHPERHTDEFPHESEFGEYRNRIGGLLLLPKTVNASSGDDLYAKKLGVYSGQNLLAKSLHEQAYKNNPGFRRFRDSSRLNFKPHPEFKKVDLDTRQELYIRLAEQIWNPERLRIIHGAEPEIVSKPESLHGNLVKDDEDDVGTIADPANEDDETEILNPEDEYTSSCTEEISAIGLIKDEIREFYKMESNVTINGFCERIAELLNLIEEKGWSELTFESKKLYCAFYSGSNPVFGAFLYKHPRFVIWMDEEDVVKLKSHCEFKYEPSRRQAIYPDGTTAAQFRPALEFVYRKLRGY